jgi:hypothetical protein
MRTIKLLAGERTDEHVCGGAPHLVTGDANGRQRRVNEARELEVVEAAHGDVLGHS